MDELDLNFWGNIFRHFEAEIQPLLHLIVPTLQGLYVDQEKWVGEGKIFHRIASEGHEPEEL